MVNFSTLKKNSADLGRLAKELEKMNAPANEVKSGDDRFWKLERDKAGNGAAVIRFLPAPAVDGEDALPWVRYFDHWFKGPTGKWYVENSRTTLGTKVKDPASEFNSYLWNLSEDDNSPSRKQARNQKRRLHYVSNILVISDPKNPENEGKVFLFMYGKKIFDKITNMMEPQFEGDPKVNPFDPWNGANFKIRIRTVDSYPNYEQSMFDNPSAIGNDDMIENIWNKEYSLAEFRDQSAFKSYDELKANLDAVMEGDPFYDAFMGRTPVRSAPVAPAAPARASKSIMDEDISPRAPFIMDDDDDDLNEFKRLAMED